MKLKALGSVLATIAVRIVNYQMEDLCLSLFKKKINERYIKDKNLSQYDIESI